MIKDFKFTIETDTGLKIRYIEQAEGLLAARARLIDVIKQENQLYFKVIDIKTYNVVISPELTPAENVTRCETLKELNDVCEALLEEGVPSEEYRPSFLTKLKKLTRGD